MTACVLIAPDKFKGTLSAKEVAEALSAGFLANTNVRVIPLADYILDLLELDDLLSECDLVITGEGALDVQSLAGKLPVALATRARAWNIPVFAAVGTCR